MVSEKDQRRRELIDMLKEEVEHTRIDNIPGLRDLGVEDVARVREFACMLVEEAMLNWHLKDRQ